MTWKTITLVALLAGSSTATSIPAVSVGLQRRDARGFSVKARAEPTDPNGYAPYNITCPPTKPTVRSASSGLSHNETVWLDARRQQTIPAMQEFLGRVNITGFDVDGYFKAHSSNTSTLPNIGIAASGGGYRALLNGAGAIQAFDSRDANSSAGGLGGLLQSATYLAGLSGGGWLVSSIYVNNFTTISALQTSDSVWKLDRSIFEGPNAGIFSDADYYDTVYKQVQGKADAGFNTTLTDYWGRALSFQIINATEGGPGYTWSSIRNQPGFADGQMPFPLLIADSREPGEQLAPGNTSLFEFGPYEFGTFDPTTYGFVDIAFLGTNISNGVVEGDTCVNGFDSASYVFGTSSSLFNQFLVNLNSSGLPPGARTLAKELLQDFSEAELDIATYKPNPFYKYDPTGQSRNANDTALILVDGGSDLQNIPLQPLIQPVRNVDVIFAIDSSADTSNWPNATALVATYQRSLNSSGIANHTAFPAIPDQNTIVNLGLNTHPTFFGCDASNTSSPTPLIVYIPNSPYVYNSNVSTFDPSYNETERDAIVANGFQVATMGNGTVDRQWPACVGCAVLSRSLGRTTTTVPDVCTQCFKRYCWDGTLNSTAPAPYNPKPRFQVINVQANTAGGISIGWLHLVVGAAVALSLV